jgi:crotonobetainyl-CoA:carnitine CoA-transferase CaiB-like acyl-CoA transferase
MEEHGMPGALAGIRIIDMTSVALGPYAMQIMADHGADVIKIEAPEGDIARQAGRAARTPGMGPMHLYLNRNKRSVALDLKRPAAMAALRRIIAGADALVHAMRPQAMAKLGLAYDDVRAIKADIVYVGAYGYAANGPYGTRPAYDDAIQALCGVGALMGGAAFAAGEGPPGYAPTILADKTCGLVLANAVQTALIHRLRSGEGQQVEVPMFESMVSWIMLEHLWERTIDPDGAVGYSRLMTPLRKPYRTRDGWICILPYTDRHWQGFFRLAGKPELAEDKRFATANARSANIDELYGLLERYAATRTTAEWIAALEEAEIPCNPVNRLEHLFDDPHLKAVGFFVQTDHPTEGPILTMRPPVTLSRTPAELRRPAPAIGEHGAEVLREAGLSDAEIAELRQSGGLVEPRT